jgi:signal transduction histidine kinase
MTAKKDEMTLSKFSIMPGMLHLIKLGLGLLATLSGVGLVLLADPGVQLQQAESLGGVAWVLILILLVALVLLVLVCLLGKSPRFLNQSEIIAGKGVARDLSAPQPAAAEVQRLNAELRQKAAELELSNQELEAFGYSFAHDLRSLMTPQILAGDALHNGHLEQLDQKGKYLLRMVNDSGAKLEQRIDVMLTLSRINKAEMSIARQNLSELALVELRSLQAEDPGRNVNISVAPDLHVEADRPLLQLILRNLLRNALKYTRDRAVGKIEVGATTRSGKVYVFVRDNGVGLDLSRGQDLFQPFKQSPIDQPLPGFGFDLATVGKIVRRHGGEIFVESAPHEGACFYFRLAG